MQANEIAEIDVEQLAQNLEEPLNTIEIFLTDKMNLAEEENFSLEEYISTKMISLVSASSISSIFGFFASLLGNIFIAILAISFTTFFFLKDDQMFASGLLLLISAKHEEKVINILSSIKKLLSRYFIGICAQITGIMILATTGLTIVGIEFKSALIIALFLGIINVIPYLGPLIGGAFGLLIGAITHYQMDFMTELLPLLGYMTLVFASVQVIDNVVFQPLIFSSSVKAHPLEIFFVIMIAGSLGGIVGMILAIPSYTVIRVVAKEFFSKFKVVQKITEKI
jgi:predicted PurR-regulated permease PerM